MRVLPISFLLFFLVAPANTQNDAEQENIGSSGNRFLEVCSVVDKHSGDLSANESLELMHCIGYVQGIVDTMMFYDDMHFGPHVFCPPKVTMAQAIRVTRKYVSEHPEEANDKTMDLTWRAFVKAFPCRTK